MNIWLQEADETTCDYTLYTAFQAQGTTRNLHTYARYASASAYLPPEGILSLAATRAWLIRANAYDAHLEAQKAAKHTAARLADRVLRMKVLYDAREKVLDAVRLIQPDDLSPKVAIALLIALNKEVRDEYGDTPAQRHESTKVVVHVTADDYARVKQQRAHTDLESWLEVEGGKGEIAKLKPPTE